MNDKKLPRERLEKNLIWQLAADIVEEINGLYEEMTAEDSYSSTFSKMKYRSIDLTDDIADAIGVITPRDKEYYFGLARRDVFSLKNALLMAKRLEGTSFEPEFMMKLDKLQDEIDQQIDAAGKAIKEEETKK